MTRVVVLACGNPSRGDDALGPALLERLERRWGESPAQVALVTDFQLQIEHAADLLDRDLALFVDAAVACRAPFEFTRLAAVESVSHTTHALPPGAVLDTFRRAYGYSPPPAFLLQIRGLAFELGAPLGRQARAHLESAEDFVNDLLQRPDVERWGSLTHPG